MQRYLLFLPPPSVLVSHFVPFLTVPPLDMHIIKISLQEILLINMFSVRNTLMINFFNGSFLSAEIHQRIKSLDKGINL